MNFDDLKGSECELDCVGRGNKQTYARVEGGEGSTGRGYLITMSSMI